MKTRYFFLVVCTLLLTVSNLAAQSADANNDTPPAMNLVKFNLLGLPFKNYSFQFERIVTKRISVAASYRFMPTDNLPFRNTIADRFDDGDAETRKTIQNLRIGNYAITPEARFYLGKGYGRGLYVGAFYRFAKFELAKLPVEYDATHSVDLSGDLKANTGGLLLGAQWALGKHIALDWFILGPHYGRAEGYFVGVSSRPLNPVEQAVLRDNLEDIDIPFTKEIYTVSSSGATLKSSGSWGGIRTGLSLAVKF